MSTTQCSKRRLRNQRRNELEVLVLLFIIAILAVPCRGTTANNFFYRPSPRLPVSPFLGPFEYIIGNNILPVGHLRVSLFYDEIQLWTRKRKPCLLELLSQNIFQVRKAVYSVQRNSVSEGKFYRSTGYNHS